jgi:two-component system CheB/CheR fusion protein
MNTMQPGVGAGESPRRESHLESLHDQSDSTFGGATPSLERTDSENQLSAAIGNRPCPFYVVGVGASAGGLEALEAFFASMPADSGMAFVVVQHLSPDFKSVMDELLARHTKIPIHRVTDNMPVEPNAVYLIPPKKEMIISGGRLLLSDKEPGSGLALPIDIFFRSLAQDAGPCAVGVILSGTGSDGSRGIIDIKDAGGFVLVQDPDSAKFDGMPKSAIETGAVDTVLNPQAMPNALLTHIRHPSAAEQPHSAAPALLDGFDAIFQLLRKNHDIDFSYYKRSTVTRRVHRRLQMHQITDIEEYVARLRNDANELNLLYKDLLIGVTKFFRDSDAFAKLQQEVLPDLIRKVAGAGELRIWVAGCATGEEPYSIAIMVSELLERSKQSLNVKIFATDAHRASLNVASIGVYSEESLSEVSPERLGRYFVRVKNGYQVSQDLRQMIVFAPHNLIKDAPFTKIDLITCRNLLIYFEPAAQKKVLSLFHFALNPSGVVMLGPSESPGDLAEEFMPIDERWRIYRKRRESRLSPDVRLPLSTGYIPTRPATAMNHLTAAPAPDAALLRAYDELLREFAPAALLINERRELVQSFSGAAEFLKLRDGRPSIDVFDLVLPDLKIPLSTAVLQAASKHKTVTLTGIRVKRESGEALVKLSVRPYTDRRVPGEFYLATIEAMSGYGTETRQDSGAIEVNLSEASRDQLQSLETELRYTKENLQATVEEMETSNEELQATNEELVASNEELQSTNEELHSVNEELYTVNAEYQKKIDELTEVTADLESLLQSTEIGVVFLDRDLCVRKFTRNMAQVFHLLPMDVGRRIDSFSHNIQRPELLEDLRRVMREGVTLEMEVVAGESITYLMRILPYRAKGQLDGVVMTLIDISALKRAESNFRLMSKVFVDGADPIVIEDLDGQITDANAEAQRVYGWSREELVGKSIDVLIPPPEQLRAHELRERCLEKGGLRNVETTKENRKRELIPVLLSLSVLTDQKGQPIALASSVKDITDRRRAEETARDAVRKRDQFLAMLSHELRNPLGAALNATYFLDFGLKDQLPVEVRETCGVIQRQMLQVARLLDDLLDVSRITQGKIHLRREQVDLAVLINDAVQALAPQMSARGHEFTHSVSHPEVLVDGDPTRLLQILENLLANAAKYTPSGGKVHLSVAKEDGEAVIRVKDNGRGIPHHLLDSIFDMFVQSEDSLDRAQGGMGIGLTLVRTLAQLHGGSTRAFSQGLGYGSEFVVRLPLAGAPLGSTKKSPLPNKMTPKNLVVVEDNDDSRNLMEALLKHEGHQVSSAKTGRQGLEMILHLKPDAAIVDIGLPEVNGYEIARRVRQEIPRQKICLIALTGYGREEDREEAREAGFNAYLVKPLKLPELLQVLQGEAPCDLQIRQGG